MVRRWITANNPLDVTVTVFTKVNSAPSTWSHLESQSHHTTFVTVLKHGDCLEVVITATITPQTGSCNLGTPKTLSKSCLTRFTAKYNLVGMESAAHISLEIR